MEDQHRGTYAGLTILLNRILTTDILVLQENRQSTSSFPLFLLQKILNIFPQFPLLNFIFR